MGAIMVRVITLTTKAANLVSIVTFNILGDITSTSKCIRFRNGKASTVPNQVHMATSRKCIRFRNGKASTVPNQFHMATSRKCILFRNGKASTCTVPNQVDMGGDRYTSSPNIESDGSGLALTMPVRDSMLAWSSPALTMQMPVRECSMSGVSGPMPDGSSHQTV